MFGIQKACVAAVLLVQAKAHRLKTHDENVEKHAEAYKADDAQLPDANKMSDKEYAKYHGLTEPFGACPVDGSKELPFAITDIEGIQNEGQLIFGANSTRDPKNLYFLKDLVYCPLEEYTITGNLVSADEFKAAVGEYLEVNNDLEAVLYNIHGMNTEPGYTFLENGIRFREAYEADTHFLYIPIMWRMHWDIGLTGYPDDREFDSITAGTLLAENADVFKVDYTQHLIAHSQGNFVTRVFAQKLVEPEILFDNLFMVAADARSDMFGDNFNPDAPRTDEEKMKEELMLKGYVPLEECDTEGTGINWGFTEVREEECKLNGGLAITLLANHVHVLWNYWDAALNLRRGFQTGPIRWMNGLGQVGDLAEGYMNLQYFRDRVSFYDFTRTNDAETDSHSYQFESGAVEVYKNTPGQWCYWNVPYGDCPDDYEDPGECPQGYATTMSSYCCSVCVSWKQSHHCCPQHTE